MRDAAARKPVTPAYLDRAATYYLERFASSTANLRRVLLSKVRRRLGPGESVTAEMTGWVDDTVARAVRSGLVDDRSYAGAKVGSLIRRGASTRTMRATLAAKGVDAAVAAGAIANEEPNELAQARRYAERRRLGPWRPVPDPDKRERDLAALCRAGFPYRIAAAALANEDPG